MADGKKKVVFYGKHSKKPLFVGTETECYAWIMRHASDHVRLRNGRLLVRMIDDPDGKAYDVGQSVMYQIVDADGNDTIGIEQDQ